MNVNQNKLYTNYIKEVLKTKDGTEKKMLSGKILCEVHDMHGKEYTMGLEQHIIDACTATVPEKVVRMCSLDGANKSLDVPGQTAETFSLDITNMSTAIGEAFSPFCGTAQSEDVNMSFWARKCTLVLIEQYKEHLSLFKSTTVRIEKVWQKISRALDERGIKKTAKQCEDKWKNLRKLYIKRKDHKKTTGEKTIKFEFEEEFDDIYIQQPNITPVATISSSFPVEVLERSVDEVKSTKAKQQYNLK